MAKKAKFHEGQVVYGLHSREYFLVSAAWVEKYNAKGQDLVRPLTKREAGR